MIYYLSWLGLILSGMVYLGIIKLYLTGQTGVYYSREKLREAIGIFIVQSAWISLWSYLLSLALDKTIKIDILHWLLGAGIGANLYSFTYYFRNRSRGIAENTIEE